MSLLATGGSDFVGDGVGAEVWWFLCAKTWVRGVEEWRMIQSVFTAKPALDRAKHQFSDPRKMLLGAIALLMRA